MASETPLIPPNTGSTVEVSIIHGGRTSAPTAWMVKSPVPGHELMHIPCYSFLIEHKTQGKKILYDLGFMKAWKEKTPPAILNQIESTPEVIVDISKDVADQLHDGGIALESINAIIWSHHHVDHTGDPSLFPRSTSLIVGPGFKSNKATYPGYPKNQNALVADDAFHGRELIELDFSTASSIGRFPAIDYFNDGSFYILQSLGHTHDHLSALARTSENKFIFLGGDVAHHPGEFRPTTSLPLPAQLDPSVLGKPQTASLCPGSIFEDIHPGRENGRDYRTTPFYELNAMGNASLPDAEASIAKMQNFDGSLEVFVVIAHDASLLDILPFFPEKISNWDSHGYKDRGI
ncbi:hypothetical protein UA08_09384 [Talaromyces atroroseus]|uniref:Metallo-beta-lactamase domain-containing protein n=1 Tax=Talaromyces atroroseus TaxID=1441469 RepID=A0A1Q5Q6A1_TALAT|nr:hypothetical protein UA08_09384 [Talaromyces atroroseus]OKL55377.1 hypothetical protein UA08_09384 [Talaromyces atroroseus]